ncbi:hypothetical protein AKJ65_00580 [candidate division MSBL1 archaeon SCGC-AAA259E19]|uniref:Tyr recombinase domain-containing protein n=1 Tax=candidate division MSBL1 archaeon SCGC-AAA259E19 TaxID=1698264 RepID=A0A133UNT3_9EURY|nr:hypothetical protein AKJ65_00580 [candidate division MSBL1 archaeon SCGC-AAA259E19]
MSKGLEKFRNWLIGSSKVSESSAEQYVYTLRKAEKILDKPLLEAQESEINELLAEMREGEIEVGGEARGYSEKYIKLIKAALKRFFNYHDSGLADKIEVEFEKWQPPSRDKLLDKDTFEKVLRASSIVERALILTLYSTGARISEIVGNKKRGVEPAKIEDLDLEEEIPSLAVQGKGGKKRIVHFLLKRKQTLEALKNHIGFHEKGPIFDFDRHRAWRLCKKAGERVGAFPDSNKNLHPHMLRHMHATDLLLDYGFNIRVIQKDLGHSNLNITSGYLSVSPEDIRKEAEEKIGES